MHALSQGGCPASDENRGLRPARCFIAGLFVSDIQDKVSILLETGGRYAKYQPPVFYGCHIMSLLTIQNLTCHIGDKTLYQQAIALDE